MLSGSERERHHIKNEKYLNIILCLQLGILDNKLMLDLAILRE